MVPAPEPIRPRRRTWSRSHTASALAFACAVFAGSAAAQDLPQRTHPTPETELPPDPPKPIPTELAPGQPRPEVTKPPPVAVTRHDAPPVAVPEDDDSGIDYTTPRYEPAGFPLIGGNSDIGFQFGGVGRVTRFANGVRPFVYRLDLLLTASVRDSGGKLGLAQQEYLVQLDVPNLVGGLVRTMSQVQFFNFVDAGYYGRGNATSARVPDVVQGNPARATSSRSRASSASATSPGSRSRSPSTS